MLVILEIELDLSTIDTACCVDLVNSNLSTTLYCQTVQSSTACHRADTTNLKCCACSGT